MSRSEGVRPAELSLDIAGVDRATRRQNWSRGQTVTEQPPRRVIAPPLQAIAPHLPAERSGRLEKIWACRIAVRILMHLRPILVVFAATEDIGVTHCDRKMGIRTWPRGSHVEKLSTRIGEWKRPRSPASGRLLRPSGRLLPPNAHALGPPVVLSGRFLRQNGHQHENSRHKKFFGHVLSSPLSRSKFAGCGILIEFFPRRNACQ